MNLADFPNLVKILNKMGEDSVSIYREKLKSPNYKGYNSIASGELFDSCRYIITNREGIIDLKIELADHYIRVEYGREKQSYQYGNKKGGNGGSAKSVYIQAIRKWIIQKRIPRTKGIEWKIANSINRNGIRPKYYLRDTKREINKYKNELESALIKDFKQQISNQINQK